MWKDVFCRFCGQKLFETVMERSAILRIKCHRCHKINNF